jgi:hypothetical protein
MLFAIFILADYSRIIDLPYIFGKHRMCKDRNARQELFGSQLQMCHICRN